MELKEYDKAIETYEFWLEHVPSDAEAEKGLEKARKAKQNASKG